jgi:predicted N-acetyltransferase YhbS
MPHLAKANQDQVEAIYRESYAIWGGGLSHRQYLSLWQEISKLPWSRQHLRFLVWVDDEGELLSSLKLYHPLIQLANRKARGSVLGAIFTPKAHRGKGCATAMLRAVIRECRLRGEPAALLFSDIGAAFYERLGFRPLAAEEQWGRIPRSARRIPDGWELRPCSGNDLPAMHRAHADFTSGRPLALIRDDEHWQLLEARSAGFFARLGDARIKQRCQIALDNGRFAGYLITVEGRGEWNVREIGAPGGDARRMAIIIRLGAYEARRMGASRFYGWLPPDVVDLLDDWPLKSRLRSKARPMILFLDETVDPGLLATMRSAYLPYQDQF